MLGLITAVMKRMITSVRYHIPDPLIRKGFPGVSIAVIRSEQPFDRFTAETTENTE